MQSGQINQQAGDNMAFVANPKIDGLRRRMANEYDANLAKLRKYPVGSAERDEIQRKEVKMQLRSARFLRQYRTYYAAKRAYFRDLLASNGILLAGDA